MVGYVAVQNSPRADLDGNKDIQNLKGRGYRGEEVAGNYGACVNCEGTSPNVGRTVAAPWHSREFVVKDCDGRLLAFGANL